MSVARWSVSLIALVGVFAATMAAAFIWLLFTDPVKTASDVSSGNVGPIVQALGAVIAGALRGLFKYL